METTRRQMLSQIAAGAGAAFFTTPGLFAEELTRTSRMAEGPFYPDKMPLDTDNDLLVLNDSITPAVGSVTHLTGKCGTAKVIRFEMHTSRFGKSTTTECTFIPIQSAAKSETRIFRVTVVSRQMLQEVITSVRSALRPIRAGRLISISR